MTILANGAVAGVALSFLKGKHGEILIEHPTSSASLSSYENGVPEPFMLAPKKRN